MFEHSLDASLFPLLVKEECKAAAVCLYIVFTSCSDRAPARSGQLVVFTQVPLSLIVQNVFTSLVFMEENRFKFSALNSLF